MNAADSFCFRPTILECAKRLLAGEVTAERLVEEALARVHAPDGEGGRTFTKVYAEAATRTARASDQLRALGIVPSPLAGLPVSIKDLFDVRGETTLAGSKVLEGAPAARADAPVVARLRAAGAIIIGRTNMTEFAYSGLGVNPHYGTPKNPYDRTSGRVPGGSSSGAAISVTDGMSVVGIGTDTGGSVRIPAALCGLTGFKPTARRIPREGALPLSTTLDSIGPLGRSVACCAVVDAILAGDVPMVPAALPIAGLRLGVVRDYVGDALDASVGEAFERALSALGSAGARLAEVPFPELSRLPEINRGGGFVGAEALARHRQLLEQGRGRYDPRVASRISAAGTMGAADYIELGERRREFIALAARIAGPYDALLMPTVARTAPLIAELDRRGGDLGDDHYYRINALVLRNPSVVNFLDGCALSVPCHAPQAAPVGLMIVGMAGDDQRILRVGQAVESALRPLTGQP